MTSRLTSKLASGAGPMLIGACLAFGMSLELTSGLAAEELRIGFIAPMTGPFAQVGKDMVNGFEMYTNEVKGDLGGATVKFILEDDQAKPPTGRSEERRVGKECRARWSTTQSKEERKGQQ